MVTAAVRACLAQNAGPTRRVPYTDLAHDWPNPEWWLAVNPGLPIEGYLPAWFVTQLAKGDVRLPGRTMGARARLERMLLDPAGNRRERISQRELGEPGCGVWSVAPRVGIIGRMMGWWQVKLSSGCPLAT